MKTCSTCKVEKTPENYSTKGEGLIRTDCKPCHADASKTWYHKNRVKALAQTKNRRLIRLYGMTTKDYNAQFVVQKGCCYLCGTHQKDLNETLHIDHCHSTGKVRKLLCGNCNRAIGCAKEDINLLQRMIDYIKNESA